MSRLSSLFNEPDLPVERAATTPQSLDTLVSVSEDQERLLRRLSRFEQVEDRVDYSDFANFVFFNSALDYFNISGELIINDFPYDGTVGAIDAFSSELDGYQRFLVDEDWPRLAGHLQFKPSLGRSYFLVDDVGQDAGVSRSAMLSPGTGSFSLEFWCVPPPALTGSNDVMVVAQKASGSHGYTAFFSGSALCFTVTSASATTTVFSPATPGVVTYYACTFDRSPASPLVSVLSGGLDRFPLTVNSSSAAIVGPMNLGVSRYSVASGSLGGKVTRWLTGSLDEVRVWSKALGLADVTSSFNTKVYSQSGLQALWRFNESRTTGSAYPATGEVLRLRDYSGHRLDGSLQSYFEGLRSSGSLLPFDAPDLVLAVDEANLNAYIVQKQTSGTVFDRANDNIITNHLPSGFFELEDPLGTDVLRNFLFIYARQFDFFKVRIDQLLKTLRQNYTRFGNTPDAVLSDVAHFFGWDFTGNFLDADAVQYLLGKNVLGNLEANRELDVKLYQIKNEFWRRLLNNLSYLYKTKGTRESVEALLRVYGVDSTFARLKEFGLKPQSSISTHRIFSEKSVPALSLGSGSTTTAYVRSPSFTGSLYTVETRVRFPTSTSSGMTASVLTGSVWTALSASSTEPMVYRLLFARQSLSSHTGSLILTSSNGELHIDSADVFDNQWYNVVFTRSSVSSSYSLDVMSVTEGEVDKHYSASASVAGFDSSVRPWIVWLGSTGSLATQLWTQEVRPWERELTPLEREDHALNFQSYGTTTGLGALDRSFHWRMDDDVNASGAGLLLNELRDISGNGRAGSGYGFTVSVDPFYRFLNEYSFIAPPDYGWNEEKIRTFDASKVPPQDVFADDVSVALEFNLIDALNEDISQTLASLDAFDEAIGQAANRYRDSYPDLASMRRAYFARLQGRVSFKAFADMLEFFDRSFVSMVRQLVPAQALFLGDEFVVESHMLERPKVQWNYRRANARFEPEGVITVWQRG